MTVRSGIQPELADHRVLRPGKWLPARAIGWAFILVLAIALAFGTGLEALCRCATSTTCASIRGAGHGRGQLIWDIIDAVGFEPRVLRAYIALLALKCTASAILHRPEDVARQLDRAERVFNRDEV